MADQPQLDLPPPAPRTAVAPTRRGFGGFTRAQLGLGALMAGLLVWGMWVTRAITAPRQERIVSARLSALVGDYVSAEARSAAPPAQVQAEMRAFMAGLAAELQRRSGRGEIVMVGEAVLTKNVPDITDDLRRAVFASGVPVPRMAAAQQTQPGEAAPASVAAAPLSASASAGVAPGAPVFAMPPAFPPAPATTVPAQPGPSVSTFGGPDDTGGH